MNLWVHALSCIVYGIFWTEYFLTGQTVLAIKLSKFNKMADVWWRARRRVARPRYVVLPGHATKRRNQVFVFDGLHAMYVKRFKDNRNVCIFVVFKGRVGAKLYNLQLNRGWQYVWRVWRLFDTMPVLWWFFFPIL